MTQFDPIEAHRQRLQSNGTNPTMHAIHGQLLETAGRDVEALMAYELALAIRPDFGEVYNNYGLVLQRQNRFGEAEVAFRRAMALRPDLPACHLNAARFLKAMGRLDEAIPALQLIVSRWPDFTLAHNNLGNVYRALGRMDDALLHYDRALALDPNLVIARNNRAIALMQSGQFQRAGEEFRHALKLDPNFGETHWNYALLLLLRGDFANGWAEYEWRWRWPDFSEKPRHFSAPLWNGENPAGKTVLVHAEQGIGDTLQFVRYASLLADRGARIILECPPELTRLMRRLPGIEMVIARGEAMPVCSAHIPLLTLPLRFGTTLQTIPGTGHYLTADPTEIETWRPQMASTDGALRVGVVWAGNPKHIDDRWRSIPIAMLSPLSAVRGVHWYSLQVGPVAGNNPPTLAPIQWIDYTAHLHDFAETAAMIAHLDLVITVDTAVAHLAGAMGKPAWVLLPQAPDWRWLLDRIDSPWYPTLRLFRQRQLRDWKPVIDEVAGALEQHLRASSGLRTPIS